MNSITRMLSALAFTVAAASALAHAKLQTSVPANAATVSAPTELRLQYNEAIEPAVSSVKVFGPGNAEVTTDKVSVDKDDVKTLVLTLPKLAPGDYRAEWTAAGHDSHRTKGEIRFTVK